MAKRHAADKKIDISHRYIGKVEWNPRSGLMSFWRIEWRDADSDGESLLTMDVTAYKTVEVGPLSKVAPTARLSKKRNLRGQASISR